MTEALTIRPTRYEHPDAVELTGLVQDFYRQVYGGPDDSPMDPQDFLPPRGQFLVGYLAGHAVAMGGWRFLPTEPTGPARPAVRGGAPVRVLRVPAVRAAPGAPLRRSHRLRYAAEPARAGSAA